MIQELLKEIYLLPLPWLATICVTVIVGYILYIVCRRLWFYIDDKAVKTNSDFFGKSLCKLFKENPEDEDDKFLDLMMHILVMLSGSFVLIFAWPGILITLTIIGIVKGLRSLRRTGKKVGKLMKHIHDKEGKVTFQEEK